ncbi:hypothetical protein HYT57_04975 [Candidatus Woesearchaeota archaeon]|nr:hypothetical protein [Candidatus Woesearchaeota archaeon]
MNRKERRTLEREGQPIQEVKPEEIVKHKRNFKKPITVIFIVLLLFGSVYYFYSEGKEPGAYDSFVTCLSEKNVKFYGSFQCPHCQNQKKMFEKSAKLLDSTGVYIECGPLGQFNTQCTSLGVTSVPLWKIGNESLSGLQQLTVLAEKSQCPLSHETIS